MPTSPPFPVPIQTDMPLRAYTTLEVGGPARWLAQCERTEDLVGLLAVARERGLDTLVLGGGSNLVVADRGFDGLVIVYQASAIRSTGDGDGDDEVVWADAGVTWDAFVDWSVTSGLAGIECLSGIPGRVGAAPIQNIGAYGQDAAETIVAVDVVDRQDGSVRRLDAADCGFGYRTSHFKGSWKDRYVVTAVGWRLRRDGRGRIAYRDLERHFADRGGEVGVAAVREAVLAVRRRKSMVLDPSDPNRRSAGSFFVNPVVEPAAAAATRRAADALDRGPMPAFPAPGGVKLSAAWLIEAAGFVRGHVAGRVGLSTAHALALINRGGATAAELLGFASTIRRGVQDRFGVSLTPEPVLVGFTPDETARLTGRTPSGPFPGETR